MSDLLKLVNYTGKPVVISRGASSLDEAEHTIQPSLFLAREVELDGYDVELPTDMGTVQVHIPKRYGIHLWSSDGLLPPLPFPQTIMGFGYIIPPDVANIVQTSPGISLVNLFAPISIGCTPDGRNRESFTYRGLKRLYPIGIGA